VLEAGCSPRSTLVFEERVARSEKRDMFMLAPRHSLLAPFHFSSSAFQYTSLTNFDQLSSRTWFSAYTGFHVGRVGWRRSNMPASRGVRSAFRLLQAMQASTQFVQLDTPPCERGTTWSI